METPGPKRGARSRDAGPEVKAQLEDRGRLGPVLVVSDERAMRETLVAVLEGEGIRAEAADSCESAVAASELLRPDLAILDERLPDGTGEDLAAALEAADPDVSILALSWHASAERILAAPGAGGANLMKPVAPQELVATVRDRLERRRLVRENRRLLSQLHDANATLEERVAARTAELSESEARLHALVEGAPDAMVVVGPDGVILLVNRQAEIMFGYERSELLGQPLELLLPEHLRHRHSGLRQGFFANPKPRPIGVGLELSARCRDGHEVPVEVSLSPLRTSEGLAVSAAIRDITERRRAEAALVHQTMHDALTGLPNRSLLGDRLSQAIARSRRSGGSVLVLFLDIDRFKLVNDSFGHSAGDELLRAVAARLRAATRPDDTVARFGGDEFVIVTEGADAGEAVTATWARVSRALAEPVAIEGRAVTVSVSMGVAVADPEDDAESLLRDADAAMYRAKEEGRARWVVFDAAMRAGIMERIETESALRSGLDRGELHAYYQPVIDLSTGRPIGAEVLARWQRPRHGVVMPEAFIPLAEETGLIVPLGSRMLQEACRQVAAWRREHESLGHISVAVNLSASQLLLADLAARVREALRSSGLPPDQLCLELTESVLLSDAALSSGVLHDLKQLGVKIGVDDFGTGYSSLSYLQRFPLDILKIDRSFVAGLGSKRRRRRDRAIVATLIDLAHAFGLTVVAEGVETEEQVEELRALGCEQAQGFYWSRPLPAPGALDWMAAAALRVAPARRQQLAAGGEGRRVRRVLVVEDDRGLRALLHLLIEDREGLEVVGEAGDGRAAVTLARRHQPDVVLLDLAMPGLGGLDTIPLILSVAPGARVVVLSGLEASEHAGEAIRRGASAYLEKGGDLASVVSFLAVAQQPAA